MLEYSELTVVKNADGISTALGYPIDSFLLQNNKLLFGGANGVGANGVGANTKNYTHLAVPAGLVCMTETICSRPLVTTTSSDDTMIDTLQSDDIVPESLYDKLFALAEVKKSNKTSRKKILHNSKRTHKQTKKHKI